MTRLFRVIFMGTPGYAVPTLRALHADPDVEVALVVTQPDRPQGRGRKLQSPPVRIAADELGLPALQVSTLRDPETRAVLEAIESDLIVVAAFGIILGPKTLNLPRLGCVNLHASLLPKYRGANPIAAAIASGESETGVTLMQMDRGLDTGAILAMKSLAIDQTDTTATLTVRLANLGANLLKEKLPLLTAGDLRSIPQPDGATLTRPMTKDDGWIDWTMSTDQVANHVRAMIPWPKAWTTLPDGTRMQILSVAASDVTSTAGIAGTMRFDPTHVSISCGLGEVILQSVQLPGGKPLEGRSVADRLRLLDGAVLGAVDIPESMTPLVVPAGS